MSSSYVLYLVASTDGKCTYVGITKNLTKRLRQHNGELKGGAKYTRGKSWRLVLTIEGLQFDTHVRQLEWRLHHPLNFHHNQREALKRRVLQLNDAMNMERWTSTCANTSEMKGICLKWHSPSDAVNLVHLIPENDCFTHKF